MEIIRYMKIKHGIDIESIADSENFLEYTINDIESNKNGENFSATILKFTISGTKKDSTRGERKIFIKYASKVEKVRKALKLKECFDKESTFYNIIAPTLRGLQNEARIKESERFKIPRLLNSSILDNEEYIALENISTLGFQKYDHLQPLDFHHLRLMVNKIANYHGTIFAWKVRYPGGYEKIVSRIKCDHMYALNVNLPAARFVTAGFKCVQTLLTDEKHKSKLDQFSDNIPGILGHLSSREAAEPYDVICHGDFWINNFWFKYNHDNIPEDICFFDWQLLKCGSVFLDLYFMLFLCTDANVRRKYFKSAIDWYYSDLGEVLRKFQLDIRVLYPENKFKRDEKKFGPYGLILGIILTTALTSDPFPDAADLLEADTDTQRNMIKSMVSDLGKKRITEIIDDYISYGYD